MVAVEEGNGIQHQNGNPAEVKCGSVEVTGIADGDQQLLEKTLEIIDGVQAKLQEGNKIVEAEQEVAIEALVEPQTDKAIEASPDIEEEDEAIADEVVEGEQDVASDDLEEFDDEIPTENTEDAAALPEKVVPQPPVNNHAIKGGELSMRTDEYDSDPEVDDELKEAIEGALRLKRLLSRDDPVQNGPASKKRKVDVDKRSASENAKVNQLLTKWGLINDPLTRHVLENLSNIELTQLHCSNYHPDTNSMWKCPAELLLTHTNLMRESKGPGGGPVDMIGTFKHRWKVDMVNEKTLRCLCHRDLRYVLREYKGGDIKECVAASKEADLDEEGIAFGAAPDAPGLAALSRFTRLELIDPVADSAVFGDANLTFALILAKQRKCLGHVGRVIATTFENIETLQERYKEICDTIKILEDHFAEVYHNVDCTRIAIDSRFNGMAGRLGAVYYNFPHAGAVGGFFDGHPVVNWRHENLMRLFFRALRSFVKPGGIVKVSSNSGAVGVRFSYIIGSAVENEFEHLETMPFLHWKLHRYGRSYGDRRDTYKRPGDGEQYNSQRAESDMVYTFIYKPSGRLLPRQMIRLPPTYKTMMGCTDGPLGERNGESKRAFATDLYKRFMMECSGIHVG